MSAVHQFRALSDFPLAWRWTSGGSHELPPEVLADIRPLAEQAARAIADEAVARCAEAPVRDFTQTYSAEWDDPERVRTRLATLNIPGQTRVLISWNAATALETSWRTFSAYWDAFCYPSSDDVTVWESGAAWSVCYRHFQVMQVKVTAPAI